MENNVFNLFRICSRFREVVERMNHGTENTQGIALNAAIMAGHAAHQARTFSEIAKQIGLAARSMQSCLHKTSEAVGAMSSMTLRLMVLMGKYKKFYESMLLSEPRNQSILEACLRNKSTQYEQLKEIARTLPCVRSRLPFLKHSGRKLFSLLNSLEIESSTLPENELYRFTQMIESFAESIQQLEEFTHEFSKLTEEFSELLATNLRQMNQEHAHESLQAA